MKYDIVRKCYFKNNDVRFLYSMRHKLKKVAFNLCTSKWINATYAHLTPFYHAKMNNIKEFWNIDADDTTILLEPKKVAQLLKEAEAKSKKDKISCYALDMWRSKTNNIHWSLGVFFVNGLTDFVDVFEKERNLDWTKTLEEYDRQFNLDWYMTYLKNTSNIKISTFYPDKTAFIHWGNFILNVSGCWFNYWQDGKIYYPIMNSVYFNEDLASTLIGDCDKIDLGNSLEESFEFLENEIPICRFFSEKGRKTNRLTDFCTKGKQIIKIR